MFTERACAQLLIQRLPEYRGMSVYKVFQNMTLPPYLPFYCHNVTLCVSLASFVSLCFDDYVDVLFTVAIVTGALVYTFYNNPDVTRVT